MNDEVVKTLSELLQEIADLTWFSYMASQPDRAKRRYLLFPEDLEQCLKDIKALPKYVQPETFLVQTRKSMPYLVMSVHAWVRNPTRVGLLPDFSVYDEAARVWDGHELTGDRRIVKRRDDE